MSRAVIEQVRGPWHHEIWVADVVKDGVPMVIRKSSGAENSRKNAIEAKNQHMQGNTRWIVSVIA